ncbi:molybdate ABC transporter substrate-binding protein [Kocuria sp. cx-455]|nr:molybdate ABC transporter substrate-binding protein [Kocuria sp. cx-455]
MRRVKVPKAAAIAAVLGTALAGCGSPSSGGGDAGGSAAASSGGDRTLIVYAAASLAGTFDQLGKDFEEAHPGTTVALNYGGSSGLVQQLTEGAPADVFASADQKNMTKLTDAQLNDGEPTIFATNTLTIVVPADNPADITSFEDLRKGGVKLVTCASEVPCGSATQTVEKVNGVTLEPVSEEGSVTDVLGKVTSGQADAGIVYVTDAKSAGDKITTVGLPKANQAINKYPIVTLKDAKNTELAAEFEKLVTGPQGQEGLKKAGFGAP